MDAIKSSQPQLLTIRDVMEVMSVSRGTVDKLIKSGDIGAVKIGKSVRVPESEIEAFIKRRLEA